MAKKTEKPIILMTGSAGKISQGLIKSLEKDYQIVGMDLEKFPCDIPVDLSLDESVTYACEKFKQKYGHKIAVVIHLAAYFDFSGEESPLYEKVNIKGTERLLKALQSFSIERFIFTSTMLVHKPVKPGEFIDETSELQPRWIYPESKLKAEEVIKKHHGKMPYLILRLAGLYDNESCVPTLANQITRIYERDFKSHVYSGDFQAGQSFIHEDDLVALIKAAIEHRNDLPKKEIILAGEPEGVSYAKLQDEIGRLIHGEQEWQTIKIPKTAAKMGSWIETKMEPAIPDDFDQGEKPFIRPFMLDLASDHYTLNIRKAQNKLDWYPKHSILDTLPKIIKYLKQNPKKWYNNNEITQPDWMTATKSKSPEKIRSDYEEKIRREHQQFLWAHFLNIGLGFWLITSPMTLGYQSQGMILSDVISGMLIVVFGFLCLSWRMTAVRWLCAAVGFWLLFAPLVFWAPTAAAYLNDTLIGSLIIGFAVLTRPDAGVAPNAAMTGPDLPPGWTFSPSSWFQRLPIIILAFIGLFISRYLTAYQLEHVNGVWEPFFMGSATDPKNGTEEIITSYVSEAWPVPDAGLGAVTYVLEILTGIIGGRNRWRTMPWLVLFFGIMIIPLGTVSITFIIIQPILLNTYCSLCLIAAAAMLLQIPYSFDEIVATCVFLWQRYKKGRPILKVLFVGDTDVESDKEIKEDNFEDTPLKILKKITYEGIGVTRWLFVSTLIGIWLMLTPLTMHISGSMANANHLIGSLVITVAITAFSEVMRFVRFINIIFSLVIFILPIYYDANMLVVATNMILAIILFIASIPKGRIKDSYGVWNKLII